MQEFEDVDPERAVLWLTVPADWRRPAKREAYTLLWDKSRDFGQLWPRPKPEDVREFYHLDSYYTHQDSDTPTRSAGDILQKLQTKLAWVTDGSVEATPDWWQATLGPESLDVLEIGCGGGANLEKLAKLAHRTIGVEPDPKARATALAAGQSVLPGTAEVLPKEVTELRFDVILFMHVLEHTISPFPALKNAVRLLKPGGLVVAEVPNNACLAVDRFDVNWFWLDAPRHLNFFTPESVCALLTSVGLHIEDVSYSGYTRQFSPDWKLAQAHIASSFGNRHDPSVRAASYWFYLMKTVLEKDRKKYDSVRVVARNPVAATGECDFAPESARAE